MELIIFCLELRGLLTDDVTQVGHKDLQYYDNSLQALRNSIAFVHYSGRKWSKHRGICVTSIMNGNDRLWL